MRWIVMIALLSTWSAAQAQVNDPNKPDQSTEDRIAWLKRLQQQARTITQATQELGNWEEHYDYIMDAAEKMFERNDWTSESDLFSMEMVRDVGSIPPWKPEQRFERVLELVGDRYLLDEGQKATLQSQMFRISLDVFARHSDRIMEYSMEALETRAAREPFTPEQIARWTKLAEPVMVDMRAEMKAGAEEFMEHLDPEQRAIVQRDLDAADRRFGDMQSMSEQWKRGEWSPEDWGMEDDPIQNAVPPEEIERPAQASDNPRAVSPGGAAAVPGEGQPRKLGPRINPRRDRAAAKTEDEPSAETGKELAEEGATRVSTSGERSARRVERPSTDRGKTPSPGAPKVEEDDWARYVRQFIEKYQLNDEQQQRAWLYYRGAKDRAKLFDQRHARKLEQLKTRGTPKDDKSGGKSATADLEAVHKAEQDRLFAQLKQRLERLPTRAQRRDAEPDKPNATKQKPSSQPAAKPK